MGEDRSLEEGNQSLVFDVPLSVAGEGIGEGHHGDGGKEAAVGGKIGGETGALIDVAVGKVAIFYGIDHQGGDGKVGLVEFRGGHGGHGKIPAPAAVPLPDVDYFLNGAAHGFDVYAIAGLHAVDSEEGRVFPIPFRVGVRQSFHHEIAAVILGQRGETIEDILPFGIARKVEAGAPGLGGGETETPVGEFECGVAGGHCLGVFGNGFEGRAEDVAILIQGGVAGHEVGSLENDVGPIFKGFARGGIAKAKLGVIDGVGLLPD